MPDFVNITINGGEYEVLKGAEEYFENNVDFSFPVFGPRPWYKEAFNLLTDYGYDIILADAPPTLRGSPLEMKRNIKRGNNRFQKIVALATKKIKLLKVKRLIGVRHIDKKDNSFLIN